MQGWRTLAVCMMLAVAGTGRGETYPLAETLKPGDCFRYRLEMTLNGELRVQKEDKVVPIKLAATAGHEFPERALHVGTTGLVEKAARAYEACKATITVDRDKSERGLRKDRGLVIAQRYKDQFLVYMPSGAMTREELEVTAEHFDTLSLVGLLPGKAVAAGDTWKLTNPVVQALSHFEGLTEQDLTCKLVEVKDKVARVSITGTASGIDLGAVVKVQVQATYNFDLNAGRLVRLEWNQKDERDQGPASPASAVEVKTVVERQEIPEPDCLGNLAIVLVPDGFEPPPPMLMLEYRDPKERFELLHGREWQMVSQTDAHTVMRLMDRGDFVAQMTLTPWKSAKPGEHLTPEEFKEAMAKTPGWEPERELQADVVPSEGGNWTYRLSVQGSLDGSPVMQNFYLVAGPNGEQLVILFTMTPKKAQKLGERDLSLAGSVEFPGSRKSGDKAK